MLAPTGALYIAEPAEQSNFLFVHSQLSVSQPERVFRQPYMGKFLFVASGDHLAPVVKPTKQNLKKIVFWDTLV